MMPRIAPAISQENIISLVAWKSSCVPHVMVEFVHPHVFVRLLALSHAEDVSLIESHHKDAGRKHPKENADSNLWYCRSRFCDLFSDRHSISCTERCYIKSRMVYPTHVERINAQVCCYIICTCTLRP